MLEYLPKRIERGVTLDGYAVPKVEAREDEKTQITHIMLDGRFELEVPASLANQVIWMIANALAIGEGYSCHGENSVKANPHKVRVMEVRLPPKEPDHAD